MHSIFKQRSSAAVVALAVGMALAVPTPAHAFLGKIVGKLFGGAAGGGSGACSSGDVLAMATAMAVGGPTAVVAGEIANAAGDAAGGEGGGCPVIEDKPQAMQRLSEEQRDELITQSEELIKANAPGAVNMGGAVVGGILSAGDQARAGGLEWAPDAADARFAETYPETYGGMMPDQMAAQGDLMAQEARDAARTSKRTSGAAVQDVVERLSGEMDSLLAEMPACEGLRCTLELVLQGIAVNVKVAAMQATMDAAHYRAGESWTDFLFSAREQAKQDRRLNEGEVGGATPEPGPDTMPEPPEEPVFDPTVPVS